LLKFGGNPNCVIAEPDIKAFQIKDDFDFIILACNFCFRGFLSGLGDGIFDRMTSNECIFLA